MTTPPAVSVLMTAYNRERLIGLAIQSILSQTMSDLELIVIDDGSTDGTAAVVKSFEDPRIKLVRHTVNRGIPAARNSGLHAAAGEFTAWLDSDDLSRPKRLERQLAYLRANQSVSMIGSCAGKLRADGTQATGIRVPPLTHGDIRCWLLFRSAFQQSSIFGRTAILRDFPYRSQFPVCEDVDMFVRLSARHRVANMPEVLVDRRLHPGQTIRSNQESILQAQGAISGPLLDAIGLGYSPDDLRRHVLLGTLSGLRPDSKYLRWARSWLVRLIAANRRSEALDAESLNLCTSFLWIRACTRSANRVDGITQLFTSSLTPAIASAHGRAWLSQALRLRRRG